jgi:hypothetical protein
VATGFVPFDPAVNRAIVDIRDAGGNSRGRTTVAIGTR